MDWGSGRLGFDENLLLSPHMPAAFMEPVSCWNSLVPQVWILLEQDLCSSHGKELVPLTPTLLNGTQKGKDREGGGEEREKELERVSFLAHTFKAKEHCIMEIWPCSSDARVMLTALKNHYGSNSSACCLVHFSPFVFHTLPTKGRLICPFVTQIICNSFSFCCCCC